VSAVGVFFLPQIFKLWWYRDGSTKRGAHASNHSKTGFHHSVEDLSDQQILEQLTSISPARLVTQQAPPFLIIHGDSDPVVPLQQSQSLVASLKEADVSVKFIVKEGGAHPWPTIREEVVVMANWFQKMASIGLELMTHLQ
jgi:acetyl esterase/lipase